MSDRKPELLPCPFCGDKEPKFIGWSGGACFTCIPCHVHGPWVAEDDWNEAAAAWNRRAALSDPASAQTPSGEAVREACAKVCRENASKTHKAMMDSKPGSKRALLHAVAEDAYLNDAIEILAIDLAKIIAVPQEMPESSALHALDASGVPAGTAPNKEPSRD